MPYYELIGFVGTALTIVAYLPQISHLVKEHCSAGISRRAYSLWFSAAALLLVHAIMIQDRVFIALMAFNTAANFLILFYANRYEGSFCASHMPAGHNH